MIPPSTFMHHINVVGDQLPAQYLTIHHILAAPQGYDVHFIFVYALCLHI